jgi:hypothetical protein
MRNSRLLIGFLLASSFILHPSSFLRADGGTVRLSQRAGGYQITVFTEPTPFRAGPVDVSVLVQDAVTKQALPETQVTVWVGQSARGRAAVPYLATTEAATNKLLQAALFELPEPGWWELEVVVQGPRGPGRVRCTVEAAGPAPRWLAFWPWVSWPALVVLLFGVHQLLVRRTLPPEAGRTAPTGMRLCGDGVAGVSGGKPRIPKR